MAILLYLRVKWHGRVLVKYCQYS